MRTDSSGQFWNLIIGAIVGAVVGTAVAIVTQIMDEDAPDITSGEFWGHVAVSAGSGAITGGLAASDVGLAGQVGVNAAVGMLGGLIDTGIDDKGDTSFATYMANALEGAFIGTVAGFVGGKGTASKHVSNSFWRMVASGTDDLTYYFSQIGRQAVNDGKKAIPGILRSYIPSAIRSYIQLN